MDAGTIVLLEVSAMARGEQPKHVAYCLSNGVMLFVTPEACAVFSVSSSLELCGQSLCSFIVSYDVERLQDVFREQFCGGLPVNSDALHQLSLIVRVLGTGASLWVRFKTVPLSLRLSRCIDAVTMRETHVFTDASCFVMNEDEILETLELTGHRHETPQLSIKVPSTFHSAMLSPRNVPLELKRLGESPSSPSGALADGAWEESLASHAFEADWSSELSPHHPARAQSNSPPS
ncbi:hypothetical protein P43SY_005181 [Pythium insidiosum]|uniref:Uncharacterized protein n=1 Tax=Pythium insidiosum TaxID=114742 RepID=A0AAD5LLV2_PYTIN|nr:hypothetical protein P43SY_005181 [Pythium insidiosum]